MRRSESGEEYNFWPVYSDLALATLFVVLLFLLLQMVENGRLLADRDFAQERMERTQATVGQMMERVPGVAGVDENGNIQTVTLGADFLFAPDDADLTIEGERLLEEITRILLATQARYTRVAVEGHADARQSIRFFQTGDLRQDHGNWRLSAERAIQVVQRFQGAGLDGDKLEAVGRSIYDPVNPDSLQQNRRMVLRIFYSMR